MITAPISLSTKTSLKDLPRLLVIHTGGTFTMESSKGTLVSCSAVNTMKRIPEWQHLSLSLDLCSFVQPIDSSYTQPEHWQALANHIATHYKNYDGFVIIHGTDTMAYTSSALSFMLEGLTKPVILTGSQVPLSYPRSDARDNFLGALEIAITTHEGKPFLQEVAIFFGKQLLRGNRTTKHSTEFLQAYRSHNYPPLATIDRSLTYNLSLLLRPKARDLCLHLEVDTSIAVLPIFPGLSEAYFLSVLKTKPLRGLLLLSYGVGSGPRRSWLYDRLRAAVEEGICVVSVSQCNHGSLRPEKYQSSTALFETNLLSCKDMSYEAALTKLMCLLGRHKDINKVKADMNISLSGEIYM